MDLLLVCSLQTWMNIGGSLIFGTVEEASDEYYEAEHLDVQSWWFYLAPLSTQGKDTLTSSVWKDPSWWRCCRYQHSNATEVRRKLRAIYSPPGVVVWRGWPPLRAGIKSIWCFCTVVGVQMDGVGRKEGRETQKQELMLICLMIRVITSGTTGTQINSKTMEYHSFMW